MNIDAFQTSAIIVLSIAITIVLALLVLLAREVGLVLVRVGPAAARGLLDQAPVGMAVDDLVLTDVEGNSFQMTASERALLVFVSPTCPLCADLMPGLLTLSASPPQKVQVVAVTCQQLGPKDVEYAGKFKRAGVAFVANSEMCSKFLVDNPPYAILFEDGTIKSKGVVNNLQHLESLFAVVQYTVAPSVARGERPANGHSLVVDKESVRVEQ